MSILPRLSAYSQVTPPSPWPLSEELLLFSGRPEGFERNVIELIHRNGQRQVQQDHDSNGAFVLQQWDEEEPCNGRTNNRSQRIPCVNACRGTRGNVCFGGVNAYRERECRANK